MAAVMKKADLLAKKATLVDKMTALAGGKTMTVEQAAEFDGLEVEAKSLSGQIERMEKAYALSASTAQPVEDGVTGQRGVYAGVDNDPYKKDKSLCIIGMCKSFNAAGDIYGARRASADLYGESHPVTKALNVGTGSAGGFIVPPDYLAEIIELLRPQAKVRAAGPRNIPMPRGTMTLPNQASAATAGYGAELTAITQSQPSVGQEVATYKKLTAVDAFVRDDLVRIMALREDLAFLMGDGSANTPRGLLSFANGWVGRNSGTKGNWLTTGNSTYAVNGTDPANSTGGNFVTANETPVLATVAAEVGSAINKLDMANVPDSKRAWFWNPRSKNYLMNVQNAVGAYVYRDELSTGKFMGYPFYNTTQIGTNYYNVDGTHTDCSFVFLAEMTEAMIFDSMQLELAVSREGSYLGSDGSTYSSFQSDQTILRAIAEHDFQLRHDQAVSVIQAVRWSPAI